MDANKDKIDREESSGAPATELPEPATTPDAGEFKIEVRKLEVPVRPRGVLAE